MKDKLIKYKSLGPGAIIRYAKMRVGSQTVGQQMREREAWRLEVIVLRTVYSRLSTKFIWCWPGH